MAHTLTDYSDDLIQRLIRSGRYNNRSEVVRAGLRLLEEREFNYLNPPVIGERELLRAYRKQKSEEKIEVAANKASRRGKPSFDE
jgi:putative addiction module CopG family antidote